LLPGGAGGVNLAEKIRTVPDFPIEGILFRDITPLVGDPAALKEAVQRMAGPWKERGVELVAAMEARGFIFGAAIAIELGAGFLIELVDLGGRKLLEGYDVKSLITFEGD